MTHSQRLALYSTLHELGYVFLPLATVSVILDKLTSTPNTTILVPAYNYQGASILMSHFLSRILPLHPVTTKALSIHFPNGSFLRFIPFHSSRSDILGYSRERTFYI